MSEGLMDMLQTLDYVFLFLYIVEQLVKVVRQGSGFSQHFSRA
jgi:hypothetical protein